jgi:hypothetical protein
MSGWINLTSGATNSVSAGTTLKRRGVMGGWYRVEIYIESVLTSLSCSFQIWMGLDGVNINYDGDGVSGVYLWGAQLEPHPYVTSYIPTAASQVTRAADNMSIATPNFTRFYGGAQGTFYCEFRTSAKSPSAAFRALTVSNDGTGERVLDLYAYGETSSQGVDIFSSHTGYDLGATTGLPNGNLVKVAATMGENDAAVSVNGLPVKTDMTTIAPTIATTMYIGQRLGGSNLNGHIKSIKYFPTRLPNSELQELSA